MYCTMPGLPSSFRHSALQATCVHGNATGTTTVHIFAAIACFFCSCCIPTFHHRKEFLKFVCEKSFLDQ
ncbi:hypothetical protein HYC85_024666 [Camellia sinensis]|uniref:Uncharacterized protein n=1 Tax=Camellia sinensis TaxID=4442 RepID=A0A7J7G8S1_CAMSI|nr:hypothetical protein HYC85_024666 [Camellia sinensis]